MLRREASDCVILNKLGGSSDDHLLQRGATRGPYETVGVVLIVAAGTVFFRGEFEGKGVEAFAYMDDTALGLVGGTEKYGESQTLPSACS